MKSSQLCVKSGNYVSPDRMIGDSEIYSFYTEDRFHFKGLINSQMDWDLTHEILAITVPFTKEEKICWDCKQYRYLEVIISLKDFQYCWRDICRRKA